MDAASSDSPRIRVEDTRGEPGIDSHTIDSHTRAAFIAVGERFLAAVTSCTSPLATPPNQAEGKAVGG